VVETGRQADRPSDQSTDKQSNSQTARQPDNQPWTAAQSGMRKVVGSSVESCCNDFHRVGHFLILVLTWLSGKMLRPKKRSTLRREAARQRQTNTTGCRARTGTLPAIAARVVLTRRDGLVPC
jgi:hypothetical protein